MRRRDVIRIIGSATVAWPLAARAQQPGMPVVGYLSVGALTVDPHLAVFKQSLAEGGFVEGRDVVIETPSANGRYETAPYYGLYLQSINAGTSLLGIESIPIQVRSEADIENAIRKVGSEPDSGPAGFCFCKIKTFTVGRGAHVI
jgi:putative ABC transport system substrate-binding protein